MTLLAKENILAAQDLPTEDVSVPEWGGTVRVRTMTGAERDAFEASLITVDGAGKRTPNMENMKAKLVALTLVGEDGKRMFSLEEVGHLAGKSAAALGRIFDVAQRLNGLGAAAQEQAGNA